jgi:EAL and modified HD-GYP domain-containing signal transduction protein
MGGKGRLRKDLERSGLFASHAQKAAFRKLETAAPLVTETYKAPVHVVTESSAPLEQTSHSIVRREAVLGSNQRVAGYAFSLVYKANPRVLASSTSIQRLYDKVLLRNLHVMGVRRLLEHRLAFVDVSASSLEMPFVEEMPPQGTVYVLGTNAGLGAHHEACLDRLKALGFRIGLRVAGAHTADSVPFLEQMNFLLIDVGNSDIPSIKDQMTVAIRRAPKIKFVATNIHTLEEYQACARLPFAFYQGGFVTSREKLDAPVMDAGRVRILELLNKLRGDAEVAELAALIKQNLALAYKLLRYINSPGMGLVHTIVTPEQALVVLGRQNLYRWLTILLFTSGKASGLDWAVMENALIRARLAELIALKAKKLSADERDELFVAGMFSLLDVVLSTPLDKVLRQVKLPAPVSDALLQQQGKYAPYLALAIACEESDDANIATLAQAVGLDVWRVNAYHLDAMLWAQQVGNTE